MQPKLLMLNAGMHDVPLILAARSLGYYVITTTNRPNYPGHRYADEYICCDYNDHDGLIELCENNGVVAVSCGTSDTASFHASFLNDHFGWNGHDNLKIIGMLHNKDEFKRFAKTIDLKSPISNYYDDESAALLDVVNIEYPVIVKPVDLAGGQGIGIANNEIEYKSVLAEAFSRSHAKRVVVEPYITGTQHSFTSFIVNKKVVYYASWDDIPYNGRFMISKGTIPATHENKEYIERVIINEIEKIANALDLVDGLFHLQYIVRDGEPYIIEVMRRAPGNWDTVLLSDATGVNLNEWIIRAEAGETCSRFPRQKEHTDLHGYYLVLGRKNGIMKDIVFDKNIQENVIRFQRWEEPGFEITDYEHEKLGLVHLSFSDSAEMIEKMNRIDELIEVCY